MVRLVGLAGSLRPGSATRMAVQLALRGAEEDGAEVALLDLASYDLPFMGGALDEAKSRAVGQFRSELRAADGMILGSPEIHGGISGVLKNALDLSSSAEFEGKVVGLVGVAGGRMGASETLSHLRSVARSLHAWVLPDQVSIGGSDEAFADDGQPVDLEIRARLKSVGRQVARFARLHQLEDEKRILPSPRPAQPKARS
jgi:NAD(P)H-dependent FMN reductase